MKKTALLIAGLILMFAVTSTAIAQNYQSTQITNNDIIDEWGRVNDNGQMAWQGFDGSDNEIYFFDGTSIIQLTDNSIDDQYVKLSENGHVTWLQNDGTEDDIMLYDGSNVIKLADNSWHALTGSNISDNGKVAWHNQGDNQIYLYDGTNITKLTNSNGSKVFDFGFNAVNNNGQVVWLEDNNVYMYNGSTVIQLTTSSSRQPSINNNGHVVWSAEQIFLYDGTSTSQISVSTLGGDTPHINNNGDIAWWGSDGSSKQLFLYDGSGITQITANTNYKNKFDLNDAGHLAWRETTGTYPNNRSIFAYNGTDIVPVVEFIADTYQIWMNNNDDVLYRASDGNDTEIFLATVSCSDVDEDGICDSDDNCPLIANEDQFDTDGDGEGDTCDSDDDNDSVLDGGDNCQFDANQDQADFDEDGAGDVCDTDDDNDDILDAVDQCVFTSPGEVVNETGCSIADLCSCNTPWKNHGAYVRCVAHTSEDFLSDGLITEIEKDAIVSEAGQSSCGHKN